MGEEDGNSGSDTHMICSVEHYLFWIHTAPYPEGQGHGHPVLLSELPGFLWAQSEDPRQQARVLMSFDTFWYLRLSRDYEIKCWPGASSPVFWFLTRLRTYRTWELTCTQEVTEYDRRECL